MFSLGLIGCGAVAHENYSKTLLNRDVYGVRYVCDTDQRQAESAAALFGAEVVTVPTLVERADSIIISTPPSSHAALLRECLRPDMTVLCEKPFMTTFDDASELCEAADTVGAHVFVGHFRRAFPQLELARRLVAMGVIGEVSSFSASEGGRFTWRAVSDYPVRDTNGGVLWDTGSHTLDMALFASGLDQARDFDVHSIQVDKDKPEPSHDFKATFRVAVGARTVDGLVHVSRKQALPNLVTIVGSLGQLVFVTDVDDRVRLTTATGSAVLSTQRSYPDLIECFDLQMHRVLLGDHAEPFAAVNFVNQIKLIETLANA